MEQKSNRVVVKKWNDNPKALVDRINAVKTMQKCIHLIDNTRLFL